MTVNWQGMSMLWFVELLGAFSQLFFEGPSTCEETMKKNKNTNKGAPGLCHKYFQTVLLIVYWL